jgi:hypothetical protein
MMLVFFLFNFLAARNHIVYRSHIDSIVTKRRLHSNSNVLVAHFSITFEWFKDEMMHSSSSRVGSCRNLELIKTILAYSCLIVNCKLYFRLSYIAFCVI